ncbi:penicillin-binding protein 2 [Paenibacillus sediminis]|uniref:Penicillin-binding protein 2 n=1 Tax=Paenibacillus sediminis TaxID=664909 RepID=A0ABS4H5Y4_9BACL|nr:penicillin-binding protein 2 [Paenibacillus sediminis]MBP1937943.1 penicillin-binding protein 2 [Paenibacillus sediminis]
MSQSMMDDPQKQENIYKRQFAVRLNIFFFSTFIVFTVLIVRLAILQFVEGPTLKEQEASIATKSVAIPPIRGTIYDASGQKIAYSTSTQSLYFTLDKDYSKPENEPEVQKISKKLEQIFKTYGDPKEAMTQQQIIDAMDIHYRKNYGYTPRRIKSGLTDREIAYFLEHKDDMPGFDIVEESIRHYDTDRVAVQTVGYLKKFNSVIDPKYGLDFYKSKVNETDPQKQYLGNEDVGYDGIEYMFQDQLRGIKGLKTFPVNSKNQISGPMKITPPQKGDDVWLTINKNVQLATQKAIMDQLKYLQTTSNPVVRAPNAKTGFAVAMEVKTGNIVAMASMPDYDSNIWAQGPMSSEQLKEIAPFYPNGTIREVYQSYGSKEESYKHPSSTVLLGSTMKPLSVLIGLNEGLFTTTTTYYDRGFAQFGKAGHETKVNNSHHHAYGPIDPAAAIEHSSNAFMVDMVGKRLYNKYGSKGIEVWDKYMEQFGLGVSTQSGLPGEATGLKEYLHEAKSGSAQSALAFAAFGQQGKYTTLQLAQYVNTLANRGARLKPNLVSKVTDPQGNVVESFGRTVLNTVKFDKSYWDEITTGMNSSVQGFEGFPYDFARKTGTSQQLVGGKLVENGVLIAFAPRKNPVLAVAVVVPEGGFGANSAAPIARKIFDAYDEYVGLTGTPKIKQQTNNASSNSTAAIAASQAGVRKTAGH